ncbi:MAG: hypothetical protein U0R27_04795 [Candidatus Nanopelagicales bacterium]|jgi:hypothetical protein|nr:hypothetical protein [Actinomycetota bacterium]HNL51271.1 hypothetical protein [Actinomycetota bacterium]HNO15231.1 hypothetical protein [Actinomycetota bacterium]
MDISPQVLLFILFMLAVVQTTRLDEMRQKKRELLAQRKRDLRSSLASSRPSSITR